MFFLTLATAANAVGMQLSWASHLQRHLQRLFKVVMFVMFVMFCSPASMAVKTGCFVLFDHVFQHWWKLHLPGKLWIYHNTVA
jgi:hypothetical protein